MKINLQFFGGRGASAGSTSAGGSSASAPSSTSTGGKMVKQSSDQWYGENDNGANVTINDAGKSDYNFFKYGNKQIYEVDRGISDEAKATGATNPPRLYAYTKSEAMQYAKSWLKENK